MTQRHTKKVGKIRGGRGHARGKAKRGRGRGSRMGRGSVKRGQRNLAHIRKYEPERFHKKGFVSIIKKIKTINLSELMIIAEKDNKTTLAFKNKKILGKGNVTKALNITAEAFTQKAKDKITKAGGQAIVTKGEIVGSKNIKTDN